MIHVERDGKVEYSTDIPYMAYIYGVLTDYYDFTREKALAHLNIISDVYLKADIAISLGALIDYIVNHYEEVCQESTWETLEDFYQSLEV